MKHLKRRLLIFIAFFSSSCAIAETAALQARDIIRLADDIRSPNIPFRYTVTVLEYKEGGKEPESKQILDVSMRFMKPENGSQADARSIVRFVYPPRDKGKIMLSDWYELWFYTPELRKPIPISPAQRLSGQISNADVIVTNFEYAYDSTIEGTEPCGQKVCYRLSLIRKSDKVTYPKVIYLVEKGEDFRPYQASYYSLDNQLLKKVLYNNYQQILGKYRPSEIIVQSARYAKGYSVMKYSNVRLETLPEYFFTKEAMLRGGQ
ncbi:outer membrane lipoprotein-sorting protein [Klebsiella michiganensis]|uniref:outer membrane lipoprotein-sorting protein n=1 Tax=Klebsiella michiganensis TaxID=1134687 RepID=UPI002DBC41F5|nr:outer membrane lipoprotein-sorting protein [Klebsiella michiganensis]MEB8292592.1 outer membrane lipoprotein-sorting protein [Klebsiella michiganensis]